MQSSGVINSTFALGTPASDYVLQLARHNDDHAELSSTRSQPSTEVLVDGRYAPHETWLLRPQYGDLHYIIPPLGRSAQMHSWLPTAPHISVNDSFPHQSPPLNDSNIRVGYPSTPASEYFVRQSFNEDYTLARQNPMGIIRNTTYLACTGSSMEHSSGIAATQVNRLVSVPDLPSNLEEDILLIQPRQDELAVHRNRLELFKWITF
ncbi:unnamed protein product [Phytophthora fragariaefolia]|uniref:Unnamed protein product n=1 Tax=Phytophthora fragariaefolia TaxID=1490495 RepID=A0A9W6Y1I7_9STRA|nr:unnamed protein product [Phytophthora fragariaefolia]